MGYVARNPIKYREEDGPERTIAPGRPVPDRLVDDGLIACGAIDAIDATDDGDETGDPADAPAKPLARMTRAELDMVLATEAVDAAAARTNAEIVAAIEAHRARQGEGA